MLKANSISARNRNVAPSKAKPSLAIIDRRSNVTTEMIATAFPHRLNSSALATKPNAPDIMAKIDAKRH